MESTKRFKTPPRIWVLRGWLIILALGEIVFGLYPFWGRTSFAGDYMLGALVLPFISLLGVFTLIAGIFLLLKKAGAWYLYFVLFLLLAAILAFDLAMWFISGSDVMSFLLRIVSSNMDYYSQGENLKVNLAPAIMVPLIGTLVWMLIDRKKLTQR